MEKRKEKIKSIGKKVWFKKKLKNIRRNNK